VHLSGLHVERQAVYEERSAFALEADLVGHREALGRVDPGGGASGIGRMTPFPRGEIGALKMFWRHRLSFVWRFSIGRRCSAPLLSA
jgi:hypothetical protein